ncbi:proton-conducting transporter transmembrane domain-containing protein [Halostagnicola kamekurae]|uniref:Multisubunit sodium/proton antiporter, MrpD subunit n=1 Tax=Halostagnicola kamekurae TaxID=619731 RepID=A0A1I6U3H2_9EURY|nr:proton-conducting transporter membrane subunit [Halostagnicola kamekurae]SFS96000.1 multisubunit sodium/proton antiporter, MrpD subunit [Halostagnicola kamekurae]
MSSALPVLLIVVPIIAAVVPIALGLRYDRTGWSVAAVTTTGLFAMSVSLAATVFVDGASVTHELGDFPPEYGIELVADPLSTLVVLLVTLIAAGVLAITRLGGPRGNVFYTGYLLLTGGLLGLALTGDVFNMFVFLEIVGLGTYALISSGDGPESAVAALKYLILGTIGASFYLIGVAFLFMATGTLNMAELADVLQNGTLDQQQLSLVRTAFAFIFVGFSIKVAQWPLHTWQPDAYQHAPDGVTPLIAALVSTVAAYALGRILFDVFGPEFLIQTPYASEIIVTVGSVSVVAGSALAAIQTDVKRMFAYSSVSQFGLVVAAYGVVTETAFTGAVIHLIGHGILKAGLFGAACVVSLGYGARTVDEYAGLARERPVSAAGVGVLLAALVGIPPSAGFVGKWYIALGAVQAEAWPVAAVILLSTMFTLAYAARVLEKMYFTPPAETAHGSDGSAGTSQVATDGGTGDQMTDSPDGVSFGMIAFVVVLAVLAVAFGFAGGALFDLLEPFTSEVFH